MPSIKPKMASLIPLLSLLMATLMLIPLDRNVLFLPLNVKLVLGIGASLLFSLSLIKESRERRRLYLALALPLALLVFSPITTDLSWSHIALLASIFTAVLILPTLILRRPEIITFKFWPEKIDPIDLAYTVLAIPLAWSMLSLYLKILSPEVPFNWVLPSEPDNLELFKLFMGINGVGIWDELFFINICYAILRALFPYRIANLAQSVIYMSVLYDMAFSGWGPVFVYILALTQGAMYERSKVLIWVLIVHLIVDYFLFQMIVTAYYPDLSVWWHP